MEATFTILGRRRLPFTEENDARLAHQSAGKPADGPCPSQSPRLMTITRVDFFPLITSRWSPSGLTIRTIISYQRGQGVSTFMGEGAGEAGTGPAGDVQRARGQPPRVA